MIRKALLIAAAVAMPVATVGAITLSAGVAGAKGGTPGPITCATSGSVTFPKPGLTYDGSLTKKTTEDSKSVFTGTGTGCSTKAIKITVVSDNTKCVGAMSPPPVCSTGDITKDPYYYDDTAGFTSGSTTADIYTALAAGIKTTDNGTKVVLEQPPSSSDVSSVIGSPCASNQAGFKVTNGPVNDNGGPTLTWSSLVCLTTDTGAGTTNSFYNDLVSEIGGDTSITIATAGIGGNSNVTIS
jgi:hypothetical protein